MPNTAKAALAWIKRGRAVIPIPYGKKAPLLADWPNLRISEDSLDQYFNGSPQNLGVLLGDPSGGLVDIDLDTTEAVLAAPHYLPPTFVYGRETRPASHRFYLCTGVQTKRWRHAGRTLLELRSTGCQSLIPPSKHPDGDSYLRDATERAPAGEIAADVLLLALNRIAAVALLALHWRESSRHDLALALAGALLHSAWTADDTSLFVETVALAAQDEEFADRARAAQDTARDFAANKPVTGWPTLAKHLDKGAIERVREWLDIRDFPELVRPERLVRTGRKLPDGSRDLVMVQTSTVNPRKLEPVWPGVLWRGKPTLLVGDPGIGKSMATLDIAARVSTGAPWPCSDQRREAGNVMLISAEDDLEDTIIPRLDAAGADRERIHFVTGVRGEDGRIDWLSLDRHWQQLADGVREIQPQLLVIDPLSAYMGRTDSHNEGDVRKVLAGVAELAKQSRAAVLAVRHFRKGSSDTAQGRVIGSVAFTAAARAVYAVTPDPDDDEQRLVICLKCNLAADTTGYSFKIAATAAGDPFVKWSTKRELRTADEIFGISRNRRSSAEEAADWLSDVLAEGAVPSSELKALAKQVGHSWRSVERAKAATSVVVERQLVEGRGRTGPWEWRLARPPVSHTANPASRVGGLGGVDGNTSVSSTHSTHTANPHRPQTTHTAKRQDRVGGLGSGGVATQAANDGTPGGVGTQSRLLFEHKYDYECLNCHSKGCRICDPQLRTACQSCGGSGCDVCGEFKQPDGTTLGT